MSNSTLNGAIAEEYLGSRHSQSKQSSVFTSGPQQSPPSQLQSSLLLKSSQAPSFLYPGNSQIPEGVGVLGANVGVLVVGLDVVVGEVLKVGSLHWQSLQNCLSTSEPQQSPPSLKVEKLLKNF